MTAGGASGTQDAPPPVARALARAAALLDRGDRAGARRVARRVLDQAAPSALAALADLVAVRRLLADEHGADVPPRDVVRWVPPTRARVRRTAPRRCPATHGDGDVAASYLAERGGVDDVPDRSEPAPGYTLDYDRAAVAPVRGAACLGCGVERSRADRVRGDGLCEGCREDGQTTEAVLTVRCEAVLARHGRGARAVLRTLWIRLDPGPRAVLAAWVAAQAGRVPADPPRP